MANQHRGVKLLTLADGRRVARFTDPITRKQVQQSMDLLGLTNAHKRRLWAIDKVKALQVLRAQIAHGGAVQTRVPVKEAQTAYLTGFGNAHTLAAKGPPLDSIAIYLAERGTVDVQDIAAPVLAAWADHVRRPANPHLVSSRNWYLVAVGTWLRWCRRRGMLPRVTDDQIKDALRRQKEARDPIEVLRPPQIRKLLKACLAHDAAERVQIGAFALTVLLTGCRYAEAEGLTWNEVDFDEQVLRLGSSRTKTRTARTITLAESPAVLDALKALRLRGGHGRVFPWLSRTITRAARDRLTKDYDAPAFSWHMLRRTCGSLLACSNVYGGGASAFLAAKRCGHSVTIAEKHYLGTITNLPKDAKTIEQAGGFEAEAATIVRAIAVVQPKAVAQ